MSQVEVEITGMAITARYGTLQSGTVLRTDEAFAKHLVDDCGAAKYVTAKAAKMVINIAPRAPEPKRPATPRKKAATAPDEAGEQGTAATAPADPAVDPDAATGAPGANAAEGPDAAE